MAHIRLLLLHLLILAETTRSFGMSLPAQEKVYLHFDQTGYFLKETMWFTAYVLNESNHPTDISKVLYVVCYVKYSPEELKSPARLRSYGLSPSNRITVVKGYTQPAVFSSPDYAQSRDRLQADFRRTLYWNPEVRADENGVARVTFFNNSTCHTLHISAEGIGGDGKPVQYKYMQP